VAQRPWASRLARRQIWHQFAVHPQDLWPFIDGDHPSISDVAMGAGKLGSVGVHDGPFWGPGIRVMFAPYTFCQFWGFRGICVTVL
jgi:glutathione S-transferase